MNLESNGPQRASWIIFSGVNDKDKSFNPIACSSRQYTFEELDIHYLTSLRNWAKKYVKEKDSLNYNNSLTLKERNSTSNDSKDLFAHVSQKMKNGDNISLFVQDQTDACELIVPSAYSYVNAGDVVRVRSFKTYQK